MPLLLSLFACMGAAAPPPQAAVDDAFWQHWGDGQAELSAYRLTQPRYGVERSGTAVFVFVTEEFTSQQRVKSDGGHDDEFGVLKLNDMRDFQTGVYDYHTMTSAFLPVDGSLPVGLPTKVSLSVQEWCGHVYEQILVDEGGMRRVSHSYFDGEADRAGELPRREGVFADALPMVVRGLPVPLVEPGQSKTLPLFPRLMDGRFAHVDSAWTEATIRRQTATHTRSVPAGDFEVVDVVVAVEGGRTTTWHVESAAPHRIIAWESDDGESAVLLGTMRSPYWQLNGPEGERLLPQLGLGPGAR